MQVQERRKKDDSEISDGVLVRQAMAGDQEAFEALVCRYKASLFQAIYRYVGDRDEAYDVLQQVWLKLYLSLSTLCMRGQIKPWLFRVARNCSIDTLRRKRLLYFSEIETENEEGEITSSLDSVPDLNPTLEELVELQELQRTVLCAIQALPHRYRSIVLLYYGNQLNFSEIGRVLNRPSSTVKTQLRRAKPFLRTALTEQLHTTGTWIKNQDACSVSSDFL